jgi:hypothetical protein
MPQALDEYFESQWRRMGYIAAELCIAIVGIVIALFIVPLLRSGAGPELPRLADALLGIYPALVVFFTVHALTSWFFIPRLRGRAFAMWIAAGILLPLLIILVPLLAYSLIYGSLFDGLR